MTFQLSPSIDKDKVFLVARSKIPGRLDPIYIRAFLKSKIKSIYPSKKIGSLYQSFTGGTPDTQNPEYWDNGNIPWVSPKDFKTFIISESEDYITEKAVSESSTKIIPENSLLLVFRSGVLAHTIPVGIASIPLAINQDVKAFVFSDAVNPKYVGYYIKIFEHELLPLITKHGATVQSINTEQFEELSLPLPPMDVQDSVVSILDSAYLAKTEKERNANRLLANIDDYLLSELGVPAQQQEDSSLSQRIFMRNYSDVAGKRLDPFYHKQYFYDLKKSIFNNKYRNVIELGKLINEISYGASVKNEYVSNGIPLLRISDLKRNEINVKEVVFLPDSFRDDLGSAFLKEGDFLISRSGTIGVVAIVDKSVSDFAYGSFMIKFSLLNNININPDFLSYFLNCILIQRVLLREKIGSIQGNITIPIIKSIAVPTPPLEKQLEIVAHIAEIRQQAKQLREEAEKELDQAKAEVERMILGGSEV